MKSITVLLFFLSTVVSAQKGADININSIQNIESTDYVVTFTSNHSKVGFQEFLNNKLIFVNTKTNQTKIVEIPSKSNIRRITSTIESKYKNSNFIVVECYSMAEKVLPKASSTISELYLVELNTFQLIKISTDNFTLKNWVVKGDNDTLAIVEEENGVKNDFVKTNSILVINLKSGERSTVFSTN